MANYVQPGKTIDYKNTGDMVITAGTAVILGSRIGVAGMDIAPGAVGVLSVEGVFSFEKADGLAVGLGDAVYYNADSGKATKTDTDTPAGWAVAAAEAADTTVKVKIG